MRGGSGNDKHDDDVVVVVVVVVVILYLQNDKAHFDTQRTFATRHIT